ncbi:hypothetical protein pqer_cds_966 [Pandoravirus quercus]|uniref:Uncharacterized protein n=2 Tax=Pandoravirus TaxID=2060084 RepID=A0A2U7UAA8_9VIRU|nr:hypothetical protein pqer_cds_966 [Pandoravirus quercus]AVK75388.1 hypothetical protein pqer_cds_966 [Pandoravirus quercus]QBZ81566.1 hypothetical protein pclt_cds_980 [Pandoravirus celtis]
MDPIVRPDNRFNQRALAVQRDIRRAWRPVGRGDYTSWDDERIKAVCAAESAVAQAHADVLLLDALDCVDRDGVCDREALARVEFIYSYRAWQSIQADKDKDECRYEISCLQVPTERRVLVARLRNPDDRLPWGLAIEYAEDIDHVVDVDDDHSGDPNDDGDNGDDGDDGSDCDSEDANDDNLDNDDQQRGTKRERVGVSLKQMAAILARADRCARGWACGAHDAPVPWLWLMMRTMAECRAAWTAASLPRLLGLARALVEIAFQRYRMDAHMLWTGIRSRQTEETTDVADDHSAWPHAFHGPVIRGPDRYTEAACDADRIVQGLGLEMTFGSPGDAHVAAMLGLVAFATALWRIQAPASIRHGALQPRGRRRRTRHAQPCADDDEARVAWYNVTASGGLPLFLMDAIDHLAHAPDPMSEMGAIEFRHNLCLVGALLAKPDVSAIEIRVASGSSRAIATLPLAQGDGDDVPGLAALAIAHDPFSSITIYPSGRTLTWHDGWLAATSRALAIEPIGGWLSRDHVQRVLCMAQTARTVIRARIAAAERNERARSDRHQGASIETRLHLISSDAAGSTVGRTPPQGLAPDETMAWTRGVALLDQDGMWSHANDVILADAQRQRAIATTHLDVLVRTAERLLALPHLIDHLPDTCA